MFFLHLGIVGCDYRLCLILAFDGCKIRFELLKTVQFNWALFCYRDENVAEFSNIFKGFKFLTSNYVKKVFESNRVK